MVEREIHSCLICGKEFDNLALAEDHVSTEHGEIVGEEGNPEHFLETLFVEAEELSAIEETPEETPDEDSVITDEEMDELTELLEDVQDYLDLPKEDRDIVFEKVLPSKKSLKDNVKTSNLFEWLYAHGIERLLDNESYVCPYCNMDLEAQAGLDKTELSVTPRFAKFKHLRNAHKYLYEVMVELFVKPISERRYDDDKATTVAEEYHLSKEETEELGREELAERISESPELRQKLFRAWKAKLERREE